MKTNLVYLGVRVTPKAKQKLKNLKELGKIPNPSFFVRQAIEEKLGKIDP